VSGLVDYILSNHWALERRVVDSGLALILRHIRGDKASPAEIAAVVAARDEARSEKREKRGSVGSRPWDSVLDTEEDWQRGYSITRDVAVVPVEGVLCRWAGYVNGASQPRGTSSAAVVKSLNAAAADPRARAIVTEFDSPGGTVAGVEEMALAMRRAAAAKPVVSWAAYLMCSAAYWVGSQAQKLIAARTALVGNIGVYQVLEDTSLREAAEGVKVHVVKAGEWKAIGVEGAPISEGQLAVVQKEIDSVYGEFIREAAAGRRMSAAVMKQLADGRAHGGVDATDLGLADGVGGLDDAIDAALGLVKAVR
jgi:signal peptide peptidase SppA